MNEPQCGVILVNVKGKRAKKDLEAVYAVADYPIRDWILHLPSKSEQFQTVTVRQDDGSFLSVIAKNPEVRYTARTWRGVLNRYKKMHRLADPDEQEDECDCRLIEERESGRFLDWNTYLQRHGLR